MILFICLIFFQILIAIISANDEKHPTILITGGINNLGQYLTLEILSQSTEFKYSILVLDMQDRYENFQDLCVIYAKKGLELNNLKFNYVQGDVRNITLLSELFDMHFITGIIHLAEVSPTSCSVHPDHCKSVLVEGTQSLLSAIKEQSYPQRRRVLKPWLIYASTRHVYGQHCPMTRPCQELSPTLLPTGASISMSLSTSGGHHHHHHTGNISNMDMYGSSKLQAEKLIEQYKDELQAYMILRFCDIYGDVYSDNTGEDKKKDILSELVAALISDQPLDYVVTAHAMTAAVSKIDRVYIKDAVQAVVNAVSLLQVSDANLSSINIVNVCSGQSLDMRQMLHMMREQAPRSQSPVRKIHVVSHAPPDIFAAMNLYVKQILRVSPVDFSTGIGLYMRAFRERNKVILQSSLREHCEPPTRALNVTALDGCYVFITSLAPGKGYLKRLDKLLEISDTANYFHLNPVIKGGQNALVWRAVAEGHSGGYYLYGSSDTTAGSSPEYVLNANFMAELASTATPLPVSIWPHNCRQTTPSGGARLPTEHFDPVFYAFREVIAPENDFLPHLRTEHPFPLYCRRMQAAIGLLERQMSPQQQYEDSLPAAAAYMLSHHNFAGYNHSQLPLCDNDCRLVGTCVMTGGCRCVAALCSYSPDIAVTTSSPTGAVSTLGTDRSPVGEDGSHSTTTLRMDDVFTQMAAALYRHPYLAKVHVLNIDFFAILGLKRDSKLSNIMESPFVFDYILEQQFSSLNVTLQEADAVFVPFYLGWLMEQRYSEVKLALFLDKIHAAATLLVPANTTLIYPMSHDYGGLMQFYLDERENKGAGLEQYPALANAIVLSPFGDFNTLAYQPHKDIVISPATTLTRHLLLWYNNSANIKTTLDRHYFMFYAGSVDARTGSFLRKTIMEGSLFPRTIERNYFQRANGDKYLEILGNSMFCMQLFGTAGWTFRLGESVYAGCIPVLCSDITHSAHQDLLDWSKFSVFVDWRDLDKLEDLLLAIPHDELQRKQNHLLSVRDAFIYDYNTETGTDSSLLTPSEIIHGRKLSPLLLTLMSVTLRLTTSFPIY